MVLNIEGLPTPPSLEERVEELTGARVDHAELLADRSLVLELRHRGTDDGALRIVVAPGQCVCSEWPWEES